MRIGILGGTFNPVHNGHLAVASEAMKHLHLDKVVFIPAYIPPHKDAAGIIPAADRYRMLQLVTEKKMNYEVCRYEIDKGEISYTVDTLRHLKEEYPKDTDFIFLIGADTLEALDTWKDIDELFHLCRFVAFNRPGYKNDNRYPKFERVVMQPQDASSSKIRKRIKESKPVSGLVPKRIEEYIIEKNLYK